MIKRVSLIIAMILLIMGDINAQNTNFSERTTESRRVIDNKKFHVLSEEVVIHKTVDEVWAEVSGNFVNSQEVAHSVNESYCLSGDITSGLGTERYLNINFQGKTIKAKERIIDYKGSGDHREFTYDVYETKGSPLTIKTYNTWSVRKGEDGKTYLKTIFTFRAKLSFLTGIIGKKLSESGSLRNGILAYKHYLETGEKNTKAEKLNTLYPRYKNN